MPLIETVTGPDLRTPEEVAEAILLVGRVCRSTGHVRVGMGASRQDVNVSVRGGRRVEIKGVPQAKWAIKLVHGEAVRQVNLLRLRDELHRRGFTTGQSIEIDHMDVTDVFASSDFGLLTLERWQHWIEKEEYRPAWELGNGKFCVRAVRLKGLSSTLSWPTQPDLTFAHELAGRIRVIAGLDQRPILLHSEKWPDYQGALGELRKVRQRLRCGPDDALVVVWGPEEDTITAANEVRLRYVDAADGVPNETRQPFPDGSTDFERILPGPDRMYPDTDSPPTRVTRERVERLESALAPRPWEREQRYAAAGVPASVSHYLIRRGGANTVDRLVAEGGADLKRACFLFGEKLVYLRRCGVPVDAIPYERWAELFALTAQSPLLWEGWEELVRALAQHPNTPVAETVRNAGLGVEPADWCNSARAVVTTARAGAYRPGEDRLFRLVMGGVMAGLRGRVPAADVIAAVRTEIGGAA
jgi:glutamyl-tRNA(Gln) amidotransferase subunit E